MKLLFRLLYEAYLGWVLEGAKFRNVNSELQSYYLVSDGIVFDVMPMGDPGDGDDWYDYVGMKPSQVLLHVKHGYWEQI